MAEKSYRIRANVGDDIVLKAHLQQDIDFLEVLSLKINQTDTYKLHTSNYGIIVGRVLANEAFGIPNARVSVFIQLDDEDRERSEIVNIYPYKTIQTRDNENRRYNLLQDESNDDCYRIVGTFPNKRLVLDNDTYIEIFDKYWKYTTITNQSGDYMIFGVPTGNQTIHVDIDLSDIGILSQKPRDFYYKGYNQEQFDSSEQFKSSTNLDNLSQILSQNTTVHVYPFFGDNDAGNIAISRCDVQIPYKFEPTCVFMGSIVSDKPGEHIGHACGPTRWFGYNGRMVTGEGTIEMIRQTPDGLVEEFPIKANRLIDGDGVWCYQIPMNLDYIGTDEFGNIIPVQDSTKGIPTRTSVRFRVSLQETKGEASAEHSAKYLVPNIHELHPSKNKPHILNGSKYNNCFEFGSATPKEYFRDLLWNKVYTVKNYIPRIQMSASKNTRSYGGVRAVNDDHSHNIFPFNNAHFRLTFVYKVLCTIFSLLVDLIGLYNKLINKIICFELGKTFRILGKKVYIGFGKPLKFLSKFIHCLGLKGGDFFEERENIVYFPKCEDPCGDLIKDVKGKKVEYDKDALKDLIQQTLALEYDIVNLDFYNDWINGVLYMPLWYWKKRKKKKYLFGLFSKKAVNTFCSCDIKYDGFNVKQACQDVYNALFLPQNEMNGYTEYHRDFSKGSKNSFWGVIKEFTNKDDLKIYYYSPGSPNLLNYKEYKGEVDYTRLYETDIILLGSLNTCDLDNLPQAFVGLPSTTANIPFIASFHEENIDDENIDDKSSNIKTFVPGLDWEHEGSGEVPKYGKGLLMDLTCWHVYTRFKSCVNLSRMSELDVSPDMDIVSRDPSEKTIYHDGLITNKEIIDNETRAKFASLNHNGLTNLVKNVTTNYDTYKFHYVYPTNFDGHLYRLAPDYTNWYVEKTQDINDNNYVKYRLGEGKDSSLQKLHKKHFYWGNENAFSFPLYNNSFYFYFGLNEGKTAIDKFFTNYYATCVSQNKFPFTIEYIAKPGKWCYNKEHNKTDFGTIDIEFNGMTPSFSYVLYNEFNEVLLAETDVFSEDLRFGYDIKEGGGAYIITEQDGYKKEGRLKEFKTGNLVKNSLDEDVYLENGVYYLQVTNSMGMSSTIRINMIQNTLMPNFEEIKLGTKYNNGVTTVENICGDMDFYGELKIKSFIIDGEEAFVKSCIPFYNDGLKRYYLIGNQPYYAINGEVIIGSDKIYEQQDSNRNYYIKYGNNIYNAQIYDEPKEITCRVECTDGSSLHIVLEPEGSETTIVSDFVCYGVGNVPSMRLEEAGEGIYTLIFNIWKPGDYVITVTQICNNVMNDNVSINTFSIENGESFQAFINDVPIKMIYNDNFIKNNEENGKFPKAWLNLEDPLMYTMSGTTPQDMLFWSDIVDITTEMVDGEMCLDVDSKIKILQYQLKAIGKIKDGAYIINDKNVPSYTLTTKGGKEPILIRNIHPNFNNFENEKKCNTILIDNNNVVEANTFFGYIVDRKHNVTSKGHWIYNPTKTELGQVNINTYDYREDLNALLGNYFAAFTNNGGLVSLESGCKIDEDLYYQSMPENAQVMSRFCPNIVQVLTNYPNEIINNDAPYIRTMFIDKRISLYGNIFYAISSKYDLGDEEWKYGLMNISILGGVPMAYDEEYNIIGNTENCEYTILYQKNNEEKQEFDGNIINISGATNVKLKYNDNDKHYYSCIYNVDGQEVDLTKKYKVTITRQSDTFEHQEAYGYLTYGQIREPLKLGGTHVNYKVSSCKMNNELTYDIDNNGETYVMKSYIEEGDSMDISLQSGNRIILEEGNINYKLISGNKYIVVNGKKCYLQRPKLDETIHLTFNDVNWKIYIIVDGNKYFIDNENNTLIYNNIEYNVITFYRCYVAPVNLITGLTDNDQIATILYQYANPNQGYYRHTIEDNTLKYAVSWHREGLFQENLDFKTCETGKYIDVVLKYMNWIIKGDNVFYYLNPLNLFSEIYLTAKSLYYFISYPQKCIVKKEGGEYLYFKEQWEKADSYSLMRSITISGETKRTNDHDFLSIQPLYSIEGCQTIYNPLNGEYYALDNENKPCYVVKEYKVKFTTGNTIIESYYPYDKVKIINGKAHVQSWIKDDSLSNKKRDIDFFPNANNVSSGYCFVETTEVFSSITDTIILSGTSVEYAIQEEHVHTISSHELTEFKCKILNDIFNEYFDMVECNSPILISGYEEKYGFPKENYNYINSENNIIPYYIFNNNNVGAVPTDAIITSEINGENIVAVEGTLQEGNYKMEEKGKKLSSILLRDFVKNVNAKYDTTNLIYHFNGKLNTNNNMSSINSKNSLQRQKLLNYQGYCNSQSQNIIDALTSTSGGTGSATIGVLLPYLDKSYVDMINEDVNEEDKLIPLQNTDILVLGKDGYYSLPIGKLYNEYVFPSNFNSLIGNAQERTGIFLAIPYFGWSGETPTTIYENNEISNYITHILSYPQIIKNETKILTCALLKTYYRNASEDHLFGCIPSQNLDAQWDVRDIYLSNGYVDPSTSKIIIELYYDEKYCNNDIWDSAINADIQLVFYNEKFKMSLEDNKQQYVDIDNSTFIFENCGEFYPNENGKQLYANTNVTFDGKNNKEKLMYIGQTSLEYGLWENVSIYPNINQITYPQWEIKITKNNDSNNFNYKYEYVNTSSYDNLNKISGYTDLKISSDNTKSVIQEVNKTEHIYQIFNANQGDVTLIDEIKNYLDNGETVILCDKRYFNQNNPWYIPCLICGKPDDIISEKYLTIYNPLKNQFDDMLTISLFGFKETSCKILKNGKILDNVISSDLKIGKKFIYYAWPEDSQWYGKWFVEVKDNSDITIYKGERLGYINIINDLGVDVYNIIIDNKGELSNITLPNGEEVEGYIFTIDEGYILKTSYNEIEVGDILLLQYDLMQAQINEQEVLGFECSDGYYYFGGKEDIVTHINSNGALKEFKLKDMENISFVGEKIIHLEKDKEDDIFYYEYVSTITKEKKMSKKMFLVSEHAFKDENNNSNISQYENSFVNLIFNIDNMHHTVTFTVRNGKLICQ